MPHINAVGDVIGFPALAAASMEQGRVAAHHACGEPVHATSTLQPIGSTPSPRSASTTLAQSDKVAALDATNKMRQIERFSA